MIYRFAFRRYDLALRSPVRTAHGLWTQRAGLWLRLESAEGAVGWGEVAPLPWFGTETVDEAEALCRSWGDRVSADELEAVPARYGCLRFALATACQPSPPPVHRHLPVAAWLPAGRAALAEVRPKADAGFRTFKWKVGVLPVADEWGLLDDLLGALPAGGRLRLDANGAWDRRQAERWLARCADRPIEFVEQPLAADARGAEDWLRGWAADFPTPLALDEALVGPADLERWLAWEWPGLYVLKPAVLGASAWIRERMRPARDRVVFSSALETAIGAQAALRVAFGWEGTVRALGFGVWPLFAESRADGPCAAPFLDYAAVERIDPEAVWTALS